MIRDIFLFKVKSKPVNRGSFIRKTYLLGMHGAIYLHGTKPSTLLGISHSDLIASSSMLLEPYGIRTSMC